MSAMHITTCLNEILKHLNLYVLKIKQQMFRAGEWQQKILGLLVR